MTSVALVVLDTLRADSFEEHFDWLDGATFTRAYSSSHWTIPAHASLFTGRYASEVGTTGTSPSLDWTGQTLAEAFQEAGYRCRALNANTQLSQYEGWERGFNLFEGAANLGRIDDSIFDWGRHIDATEPGIERYLSGIWGCLTEDCNTMESLQYGYGLVKRPAWDGGARAVRRRLEHMEVEDEEFLFVNLMDTHTPYHPPPGSEDPVTVVIADAFADGVTEPEKIRAAYRAATTDLAEVYRDIVAILETEYEYVITLSDHGELLGEHGLWNHSVGLHPELVHVPLVVNGPDIESGYRHEPVNLLDVHRTVAELASVDVASNGRDLFGLLEPKELLFESHGLLPFHRSQFERVDAPLKEFERWQTDLAGFVTKDGAYYYESEPGEFAVIGKTKERAPRDRLEELKTELDRREVEPAEIDITNEVRKRLEELGYA
ncbi:Arylsulfatase A or related enzyme [Halanaeroarchaeum sp. HSR-CO]|uniref:sulfatase-like hydrolase/transferase n=1 Tax=Halanaeroarchaeum sp. HSR-CO TaxID=2866382 RepID=UPI00217D135D|nr:sulfatase-like hydrolase/transferase [Halanaeroarchaeum sp. HSR-CO]UWG47968.1 Arylsulfatase A or related enzyme [Halanaeroarchaeum sp. HSR-CO]